LALITSIPGIASCLVQYFRLNPGQAERIRVIHVLRNINGIPEQVSSHPAREGGNRKMKGYGLIIAAGVVLVLTATVFLYLPGHPVVTGQATVPPAVLTVPSVSLQPSAPPAAPVSRDYQYVLRGENGTVRLDLDPDLYNRIAAGTPPKLCLAPGNGIDPCPANEIARFYRGMIDRPEEKPYLEALAQAVREKSDVRDDQARIAISLVQQIPYGYNASYPGDYGNIRYPYMVLYDNSGICDEKSLLLASLLKELGYGTALISFPGHEHMVVGIRSPAAYAYNATGYAFVETTFPAIATDDRGEYGNGGTLTGPPVIYPIADGASFDSVSAEYADAREFIRLRDMVRIPGGTITVSDRAEARALYRKYGLFSTYPG
jgi:hypothetical protein